MILHVVTPCIRPQNLPKIADSLRRLSDILSVRWWIMLDPSVTDSPVETAALRPWRVVAAPPGGAFGNAGRNAALDAIRSGWVHFLDDDNDIHPEFGAGLAAAVAEHPEAEGFVFDQFNADSSLRLRGRVDARPGEVDSAQFVFRRRAIGRSRWRPEKYGADGYFFEAVSQPLAGRVVLAAGSVWYNRLRPA